jgi:plasmid stabilization system protein ParE
MAAARVVLSDDAQRDLEEIWTYLAHKVSSRIADFLTRMLPGARHSSYPYLHLRYMPGGV